MALLKRLFYFKADIDGALCVKPLVDDFDKLNRITKFCIKYFNLRFSPRGNKQIFVNLRSQLSRLIEVYDLYIRVKFANSTAAGITPILPILP